MAFWSPLEWPRVALLDPAFRASVLAGMEEWEKAYPGKKLAVPYNGGFRAEGVQETIVDAGDGRAAPAGLSLHEYGEAIDLKIVGVEQNAARDQNDPRYRKLGEIMQRRGLRAGVFFRSGDPDPYHIDTGNSVAVARANWERLKKKGSESLRSSPSLPYSFSV